MSFPRKSQIEVASVQPNHFDLTQQTIGTLDFGFLQPVMVRSVYPKCSFNVKPECFVRTAPLVVPPFARCRFHFDTFFVPFFQVWKNFKHFYDGSKAIKSSDGSSVSVTQFPYFDMREIFLMLCGTGAPVGAGNYVTIKEVTISSNQPSYDHFLNDIRSDESTYAKGDFVCQIVLNGSMLVTKYRYAELSPVGRRFVNLLFGLGYGFNLEFTDPATASPSTTYYPTNDTTKLNALRLLSFIKVYVDWYQHPQFTLNSVIRNKFNQIFDTNVGTKITSSDLDTLFTYSFSRCYDPDFFTSSWLKPYQQANANNSPATQFVAPSNEISGSGDNGATLGIRNSTGTTFDAYLTQKNLSLLEKYQEFIQRFNISGSRDIDRYLAEFGVKGKEVELLRSMLVHSYTQDLQISDIMSTANTETGSGTSVVGSALGSYAGKGLSYGNSDFSFESNDFGVLFTICSIVPVVGYAQGRQKEVEQSVLLDLPTGEFDNVGSEAVTFSQLQAQPFTYGIKNNGVFGYVPRYAHCKIGNDCLFGDFRLSSRNKFMEAWHFIRDFHELEPISNTESFRQIGRSQSRLDRIFNVTNDNYDHFYLFFNFNIQAMMPFKSISDVYELKHVDDGENHREITVDYGGKQL